MPRDMPNSPVLIFGYGNPSRGDDALGPLLVEKLEDFAMADVECLTDFQLQVENSLDLLNRKLVLFVDAHLTCLAPFQLEKLEPASDTSYTTHAMSPASVLQVFADTQGNAPPPAFLLSLRGYEFELGAELSEAAADNLKAAVEFVRGLCLQPVLEVWLARCTRY